MRRLRVLIALSIAMMVIPALAATEDKKPDAGARQPAVQLPAITATYVITDAEQGFASAERQGTEGPDFITFGDEDGKFAPGDEVKVTVTVTKKSGGKNGDKPFVHGETCKCHACQRTRDDVAAFEEMIDAAAKAKTPEELKKLMTPLIKKVLK